MVYGRYNYSIHGVYKPTNITGGHRPEVTRKNWTSTQQKYGDFTQQTSGFFNGQTRGMRQQK